MVYQAVKHFLTDIKHPDCMQFRDINISDRVSGADIVTKGNIEDSHIEVVEDNHNCLHDKTQDINANAMFLTTDSEFLEDRLKIEQKVYRTLSCHDLAKGLRYHPQKDGDDEQLTPPESEDEENSTTLERLFRSSTPKKEKNCRKKLPYPVNLQDILYDPVVLQIQQDIIATPACHQQGNIQRGAQRLNQMAQNAGLRGADSALVQILNRMQDRDEQQDNTCKKLLMFPKTAFHGTSKSLAKTHWLEFNQYVEYQQQHNLLDPDNQNRFSEVKPMFRLTLSDNALGWYDAEQANWTTMDHMKQAFLKRFNIWGDTRHQQQDAWNKLIFDMSKDDVDSFVTEMCTLASILGHNNDVLVEKFKDIFSNKNIKAALIAMDDFNEMQAKAKQLVQIYRPTSGTDTSSLSACLMHTHEEKPSVKPKKGSPKVSNQHQLAPTQNSSNYYGNNSSGQNQGQRQNDQKGFNKDNGSYQETGGYFRQNNFCDSHGRGCGRGSHRKGGKLPWKNNNDNQGQSSQKNNDSQRGRGGGGQNNKGRGCGYDQQQQQYNQGYNPQSQGQYQYLPPPPTPPQSLLPAPPPYDPNWQLRQTQFYNSPAVSGYASQGQYPQNPTPSQHMGDRQNYRPS